jgi:CelD/BcsL family acetyltransferase involved in cellulose biosynthesis
MARGLLHTRRHAGCPLPPEPRNPVTSLIAFDRKVTLDATEAATRRASPAVATRVAADGPVDQIAAGIEFDLISSRAGFDALEADWTALFNSAAAGSHVFQSFNWLWHWANHYLPNGSVDASCQVAIVTGRRNGRLVLVWPLVMSETRFVRQISWMGEPASQYGDVLVEDGRDTESLLRASWTYLIDTVRPDVVHLRKVRSDARVAPLLAELQAIRSAEAAAPYLALGSAPTFDAYEERYTAKARKNRRRLLRRLGERAGVAIETYREGPAARALADLAVSLKRAWLHDRGQLSSAFADPRFARFLGDACEGRGKPTGARVSVLRSGGEPASIEVGFEAKGTLSLHIIVYSLKFEKSGAGVLHLEDGIRRCFADGITTLDLLAPRAEYKMDWADDVIQVADHSLPLTGKGRAYAHVVLRFMRTKAKDWAQRLPVSIRRALG